MGDTSIDENSTLNEIALDAIKELDAINQAAVDKSNSEIKAVNNETFARKTKIGVPTKDDAVSEMADLGKASSSKTKTNTENIVVSDDDDDVIEEFEVTRTKKHSNHEQKKPAKGDNDAVGEIEVVSGSKPTKGDTKKLSNVFTEDAIDEIELVDQSESSKNEKKKQSKIDDEIEVVSTEESTKTGNKKRKKVGGDNSGDCNCEYSVAGKQRKAELDGLQTLLSQQQQTLQSQQLLQQQQYVQQKEFLKQQSEFMKHQKLTMENMDKLLQVLANNAAVWSGLGDAIAPCEDQVKQEKIKSESKDSTGDATKNTAEGDDEIAILPTPEKVIETVNLDDQDGKDGKNKKNYYNVYRGSDINDRMPTAEEKRVQEEVTKLLKG